MAAEEEYHVANPHGCTVWSNKFDLNGMSADDIPEPMAVLPLATSVRVKSDPAFDDAALAHSRQPANMVRRGRRREEAIAKLVVV